jgi:hypothetical protein
MRRLVLTAVAVASLALAPAAMAKTTKGSTFKSKGTAVSPGAVAGLGTPGTYEDFKVTIPSGDRDGSMTVTVDWANPADDWDLYVYEKVGSTLETVGSSAGGPPSTEEKALVQSQGVPLTAGQYVIRVQNYAASSPQFTGSVKFTSFKPLNKLPTARLKAPKRTRAHHRVTLSAKGSKDPDGRIVNYAFDLNGDGAMDVFAGKHAKIRHRFKKPGRHHVTVRVIDDKGARAYATRTILVYPKK